MVYIWIQRMQSMYTVHQTRKYICENNVENYNPLFDMLHECNSSITGNVQQNTSQQYQYNTA